MRIIQPELRPEVKAEWGQWLLDNADKQGPGFLNKDGKLCCLGGLCEIAVKHGVIPPGRPALYGDDNYTPDAIAYAGSVKILPEEVQKWAFKNYTPEDSLNQSNPAAGDFSLAEWNDGNGSEDKDFPGIKALIDEYL